MFPPPEQLKIYPTRDTWAPETEEKLHDVFRKQKDLKVLEKEIRERCNHTKKDGTSTLITKQEWNEFGGFETHSRCSVCNSLS